MLGLQAFISCGKEGSGDACRKPSPGMWHLLERHLNGGVPIDKERCAIFSPFHQQALLFYQRNEAKFCLIKLEVTVAFILAVAILGVHHSAVASLFFFIDALCTVSGPFMLEMPQDGKVIIAPPTLVLPRLAFS